MAPWGAFWSVTLRHARLALLGGCLLVSLYLLAEYGAFSLLRYQTFTTEIFTEYNIGFNTPAASALSLVLVALGLLVLGGEGLSSRSGRRARPAARPRRTGRARLGRGTTPVVAALAGLVGLALGVPIWAICYWSASGQRSALPAASSLAAAAWHTALYSGAAAGAAMVAALPVAILAVRHRGRLTMALERACLLVQALPGLVVALALVFFAVRYARFGYQSAPLLVAAYVAMFFPRALVAVQASVARVPVALEDVARSLGHRPAAVLVRVTLPLVLPGLLAAFFLVFLTAVTELTATLVLVPTGARPSPPSSGPIPATSPTAPPPPLPPPCSVSPWCRPTSSAGGSTGCARWAQTGVAVRGLTKSFGDHVVLDGVDLEVAEGSLTAVLGPSGSGKTTLLRILAGFERAGSGSVALGDVVVEDQRTHVPPESRRIGYVPQDGALVPPPRRRR